MLSKLPRGRMVCSPCIGSRCSHLRKLEKRWFWSGQHYARTCNAWLERMDSQKVALRPLFEEIYGRDFAALWWQRWRMFFMACAELFAYRGGQEWFVGHFLFRNKDTA